MIGQTVLAFILSPWKRGRVVEGKVIAEDYAVDSDGSPLYPIYAVEFPHNGKLICRWIPEFRIMVGN